MHEGSDGYWYIKADFITYYDNETWDVIVKYTSKGLSRIGVKSNGSVGIGTLSPAQKLHVVGKARDGDREQEYTEFGHNGSNGYINTVGDGNLDFRHDGNIKMVINPGGYVGIGTTSPKTKLHVNGDARVGLVRNKTEGTAGYGNKLYFSGSFSLVSVEKYPLSNSAIPSRL